jgi:hypothetical protein
MKDKLIIVSSVAVISLVIYGAYLLSDVKKSSITSLQMTVDSVTKALGGTAPVVEEKNAEKMFLVGGIILLFVITLWSLRKK